MKKYLLSLALILIPLCGWGQAKVYTMKMKIADFPAKTTMVVLDGDEEFRTALRDAVSGFWRLSPYEFCSEEEYGKSKNDNSFYFIRPVVSDGICWLSLSKGGKEKAEDSMKASFELTRIPVGIEYAHFGAFIDILQDFTEKAMESDRVAYSGLRYNNGKGASEIRRALKEDPESIVTVRVDGFEIVYDAMTHELYRFKK